MCALSRNAAATVLVLIPCFWQARHAGGDLASHLYNAWLVQLAETRPQQGAGDCAADHQRFLRLDDEWGLSNARPAAVQQILNVFEDRLETR